jgi:hypothetical protein
MEDVLRQREAQVVKKCLYKRIFRILNVGREI